MHRSPGDNVSVSLEEERRAAEGSYSYSPEYWDTTASFAIREPVVKLWQSQGSRGVGKRKHKASATAALTETETGYERQILRSCGAWVVAKMLKIPWSVIDTRHGWRCSGTDSQ